jgi:apolipoprotein N-acyltransferase
LPLPVEPTVYARWGDIWAALFVALAFALCLRRRWRLR